MSDFLQELKQEFLANYYYNKINKIENKKEVLVKTQQVLKEIIDELQRDGAK